MVGFYFLVFGFGFCRCKRCWFFNYIWIIFRIEVFRYFFRGDSEQSCVQLFRLVVYVFFNFVLCCQVCGLILVMELVNVIVQDFVIFSQLLNIYILDFVMDLWDIGIGRVFFEVWSIFSYEGLFIVVIDRVFVVVFYVVFIYME